MNGITATSLLGIKRQTNKYVQERDHVLVWQNWGPYQAEARCKFCDAFVTISAQRSFKHSPTYPPYVGMDDGLNAECIPAIDNVGVGDLRVKMEQVWDNDSGDSYRLKAVFPLYLTDEQIREVVSRSGYDVEGNHCQHSYDCCGNWYSSGLFIDRMNTKVEASIGVSLNV